MKGRDKAPDSENKAGVPNFGDTHPAGNFKDLFKEHKAKYTEYLRNFRNNTEKTIKDDISALEKLPPISTKEDMLTVKLTAWQAKGLSKFLTYLDRYPSIHAPLGIPVAEWRELIKKPKAQARHKECSDDDIREAYRMIKPEYKTAFKLKVYSGSRTEHLYGMLKAFNPDKVIFKDKIALYPSADLAKGEKQTFYIFFPSLLFDDLKQYQLPPGRTGPKSVVSSNSFTNALTYGKIDNNTIRAWYYNVVCSEENDQALSSDVADFIQGRAPKNISAKHYLNRKEQAIKGLNRLIDRIMILEDIKAAVKHQPAKVSPKPANRKMSEATPKASPAPAIAAKPKIPAGVTNLYEIWKLNSESFLRWLTGKLIQEKKEDSPVESRIATAKAYHAATDKALKYHTITRPEDVPAAMQAQSSTANKKRLRAGLNAFIEYLNKKEILGHAPEEWLRYTTTRKIS